MINPDDYRRFDDENLPYVYNSWDLYWDVINLMTVHYSGDRKQFDMSAHRIAEEIRGCGQDDRAGWIEHMIKTQAPPSREWESAWFDTGEDLEGV